MVLYKIKKNQISRSKQKSQEPNIKIQKRTKDQEPKNTENQIPGTKEQTILKI